jgi:hypothetical protein
MYGYEPPKSSEEGSWRETFAVVLIAFRVLLPVMGIIAGVMGTVVFTLYLATIDGRLMLVPIMLAGGILVWFLRRERRQQAEEQERLLGPRSDRS